MKNLIILTVFFFTLTTASCKKSTTSNTNTTSGAYTPDCSGTAPTFSATVSSLIISSCGTGSGCHASGSSKGPGALINYTQIKNSASAVRSSVVSGSMPQGTTLSAAQKNTIVCWIDAGALNN